MVTGATDDVTRAATSGVLILVFGLGLLALARGWAAPRTGRAPPRCSGTPSCCRSRGRCTTSDRTPVALAVGLVAVASIVAAVSAPGRRADGGPDGERDTDVVS